MPVCYVVPGLLSSEIGTGPGANPLLWVHYTDLVLGKVGALRLAPDGILPGPPDGLPCFAGGPLPSYFDLCVMLLASQLAPHGYRVIPWGYDWRKRVRPTGAQLAEQIRAQARIDDPCTIVAHSLGGLVARAAWWDLVRTGDQAKVRRIVTLGTPHQGSYGPVVAWSGGAELVDQLSLLSSAAFIIQTAVTPVPYTRPWTSAELIRLLATWPTFYELLPQLGGTDAANDPFRAQVYEASKWPSVVQVSSELLQESRDSFGPWLKDPNTVPPPWVLTTVAGDGIPTTDSLRAPELLGRLEALTVRGGGDSQVTVTSALIPTGDTWIVPCRHQDLPQWVAAQGLLAQWVLDVRTPITPVPPATVVPGAVSAGVQGPPLPVTTAFFMDC